MNISKDNKQIKETKVDAMRALLIGYMASSDKNHESNVKILRRQTVGLFLIIVVIVAMFSYMIYVGKYSAPALRMQLEKVQHTQEQLIQDNMFTNADNYILRKQIDSLIKEDSNTK